MKLNLWLALPAALTALAVSQPAAAAVVTYTYTGTVASGFDGAGLFGGGDLGGKTFTAVFSRDDDLAQPGDLFVGDINSYVTGEGLFSPVGALITIGGFAFAVGGESGEQSQYDDGVYEGFKHQAAGNGAGVEFGGNTIGTFGPAPHFDYLAGPDYHTLGALSQDDLPGFALYGGFQYVLPDAAARALYTSASFDVAGFSVSPAPGVPAGVPEPSAWALMILGFGAAGAALRRRQALVAA
jgi:hypothetical protein